MAFDRHDLAARFGFLRLKPTLQDLRVTRAARCLIEGIAGLFFAELMAIKIGARVGD
jgi:hypothetical protein